MRIFIGAMEAELQPLIKELKALKVKDSLINEYKSLDNETIIAATGIGLVNASTGLSYLLTKYHGQIDYVINAGTAGCLNKNNLKRGDFVIVEKAYYSTADVTGFGYDYGQIPGMNKNFEAHPELMKKIKIALKDETYIFGNTASSDIFFATIDKVENFTSKISANITIAEMECAAYMQTATIFGVPMAAFKIVSDVIGDKSSNEEQFDQYLPRAAKKLKDIILKIN